MINSAEVISTTPKECKISKNLSQHEDHTKFFELYNNTVIGYPYIQSYIDSFQFQFPYTTEITTWYNGHMKNDHQIIHNHISTNVPTFSAVLILKQPNADAGQFCFHTPNLSNHLKYLELDPFDKFPNTFQPLMEDGVFMVFPSCMEHYVTYNRTDEIRIVFASNIRIMREEINYG
jgi:hypothetical protein